LLAPLLSAAATGCIDDARGHFATAGFADGEVKSGDPVFVLDRSTGLFAYSNDGRQPNRVVAVRGDVVDLGHGRTASRSDVAAGRLAVGTWVVTNDARCPSWEVATGVDAHDVSARCRGTTVSVPLVKINLPTRERLRRKTADIVVSAGTLGAAIVSLVVGVTMRGRTEQEATKAARKLASSGPMERSDASGPGEVEVLRCAACGRPVPLADAPDVRCRACGAQVVIPPSYTALLAAQRDLSDRTARASDALRLAAIATHPAGALALFLVAAALAAALRFGPFRAADGFAVAIASVLAGGVAVGLCFSAVGQLFGYAKLQSLVPALRARPAEGGAGFDCRSCGAPLRALTDGAEVCVYCRAQNVIDARITRAGAVARAAVTTAEMTLEAAVARTKEAFWVAVSYPLFYVGILGVAIGAVLTAVSAITYP
jgi:DNA-directed RNA polymerase subunit RPC12/RpoP